MQEVIEIIFDLDGQSHMEGKGFTGKSCDKAMADFEKALGKVTERKNKPDYFKTEVKSNATIKTR
jgi:hypothetical protein